ncbi:immunoglobulin domain-containing protein [Phthorimaea operculella]|nr:immunoglobulin domain-containing protein [Phthorimaea operculella]
MESAQHINVGLGAASLVEECTCPPGYEGLSCQKCASGYTREKSGPWLGTCVAEQRPCPLGTYGDPRSGYACRPCPCPLTSPGNNFARGCSVGPGGRVVCDCAPGYGGETCEYCEPGYVGNPLVPGDSCKPEPTSNCNPLGTLAELPFGECQCKENVQGQYCDQCKDYAYFLSEDNRHGCASCFCSGVTSSCRSSNLRRKTTSVRFNTPQIVQQVKVYQSAALGPAGNVKYNAPVESQLRPSLVRGQIALEGLDRSRPTIYYWSLPVNFAGDKVTSYGGYLTYQLSNVPPSAGPGTARNTAADVQLISENRLTFHYFGNFQPTNDGVLNASVQLLEKGWQRADGKEVSREHFLLALADVKAILVKASYSNYAELATIDSASIETAEPNGNGPPALHVEQCVCPVGYIGTSCEDCAPGYTRNSSGLYLEQCALCDCGGHSSTCHPETGVCYDCRDNTDGENCELCKPGYEKNPYGVCEPSYNPPVYPYPPSNDCDRCNPAGTEGGCDSRGICQCKQNVEGEYCDVCRPGTFGLDRNERLGCMTCYCSGVTNECHEAGHFTLSEIPVPVFGANNGGYTITDLNGQLVINDQFVPDPNESELMYAFNFPPTEPLYWSLPGLPGNRVLSYGSDLTLLQKFEAGDYQQESTPGVDVVLVGDTTSIYWTNPNKLQNGVGLSYSVPIREGSWYILNSATPATRNDIMSVLKDLKRVLVRADVAPNLISTSIADVSMGTAIDNMDSQPQAKGIEVCVCPVGYSGMSCETCAPQYYRDPYGQCRQCPCNGNDCSLGYQGEVVCNCRPPYSGRDCSTVDGYPSVNNATSRPPPPESTVIVRITSPTIKIEEVGGSVNFTCMASSQLTTTRLPVSWIKEGGELPQGRHQVDPRSGLLLITNLQISDSGTYICQTSDGVNTAQAFATLRVPGNEMTLPSVSVRPESSNYQVGERIELECIASGNPQPRITWQRAGNYPLPRSANPQDTRLVIERAMESDSGEYRSVLQSATTRYHAAPTLRTPGLSSSALWSQTPESTGRYYSQQLPATTQRQPQDTRLVIERAMESDSGEYRSVLQSATTRYHAAPTLRTPGLSSSALWSQTPESTGRYYSQQLPATAQRQPSGHQARHRARYGVRLRRVQVGTTVSNYRYRAAPTLRTPGSSSSALWSQTPESTGRYYSQQLPATAQRQPSGHQARHRARYGVQTPESTGRYYSQQLPATAQRQPSGHQARHRARYGVRLRRVQVGTTVSNYPLPRSANRQDTRLVIERAMESDSGEYRSVLQSGTDRYRAAPTLRTPGSSSSALWSQTPESTGRYYSQQLPATAQRQPQDTRLVIERAMESDSGEYRSVLQSATTRYRAAPTLRTPGSSSSALWSQTPESTGRYYSQQLPAPAQRQPSGHQARHRARYGVRLRRVQVGTTVSNYPLPRSANPQDTRLVIERAMESDSGEYRSVLQSATTRYRAAPTLRTPGSSSSALWSQTPESTGRYYSQQLPATAHRQPSGHQARHRARYGVRLRRVQVGTTGRITWQRAGNYPLARSANPQDTRLVIERAMESDSGEYRSVLQSATTRYRAAPTLRTPGSSSSALWSQTPESTGRYYRQDHVAARRQLPASAQRQPSGHQARHRARYGVRLRRVQVGTTGRITWQRAGNYPLARSANPQDTRLVIERAMESDSGEYSCIATNTAGSTDRTAVILVRPAAYPTADKLSVSSPSATVKEGQTIRIVCTGTQNIPAGAIDWIREDKTAFRYNVRSEQGVLYIDNAVPENRGIYVCQASSPDIDPVSVVLSVIPLASTLPSQQPNITIPEDRVVVSTGDSRAIECIPLGYPQPRIRWSKHGGEFGPTVSQRDNSLIISNAREEDDGYYVCEGIVDDSPVVFSYVYVTVTKRVEPRVEIWPQGEQAVTLGSQFEMHCRVLAGVPEPDITWSRSGGRPLSPHVQMLKQNVLRFENIEVNDEGEYQCVARNEAGTSSASAVLKVRSTPEITITPNNYVQAFAGDPVNVECRASGYPEPMVSISSPDGRVVVPESPGIASLRISSASDRDEGDYLCSASNAAGRMEDQFAIRIQSRGDIDFDDGGSGEEPFPNPNPEQPASLIAVEGEERIIDCEASAGFEVRWGRVDGRPLQPRAFQSGNSLVIRNASKSDSGRYECTLINRYTNEAQQAAFTDLQVVSPPRITLLPKTQTVHPGESPTVECIVTGENINNVTWDGYLNRPLPPRVERRRSMLIFHQIEVEDAGKYECFASNSYASASAVAEVIVSAESDRPTESHENEQWAHAGAGVHLTCNVTQPNVRIRWTKDGRYLPASKQNRDGSLYIRLAQQSDSGHYVCHIQDVYGRSTSNYINLHIEGGECSETQYRCDDGTCIDSALVCDGNRDCSDDEDYCYRGKRGPPVSAPSLVKIDQPRRSYRVGENVEVLCRRANSRGVTVTWERYNPDQQQQYVESRTYGDGSMLIIHGVQEADAGVYRCTGRDYSHTSYEDFNLEVIPASFGPSYPLDDETRQYTARLGQSIDMPCEHNLEPPYSYEWRREYTPLPPEVNRESYTARLGQSIDMPCEHNLEPPYSYEWRREYTPLPPEVNRESYTARLGQSIDMPCEHNLEPPYSYEWRREYTPLPPEVNRESYTARLGQSIDMPCEHNLEPPYSYEWRREYTPLPPEVNRESYTARLGQSIDMPCEHNLEPPYSYEWRREYTPLPPEVNRESYTARLGQSIDMPCEHNLEPPYSYEWRREYTPLPPEVNRESANIHLERVTEADAGTYVCRVTNPNRAIEARAILRVEGVVPRFGGFSYLALPTIKDAYQKLDIEVSFKPADYNGLILYNDGLTQGVLDYIGLRLVNGTPELVFDAAGEGRPNIVRGDRPLQLNTWHTVRVSRINDKGRPNIVRGDRPLQLNTWHTVRVSRINDKGRSSLSLNLKLDTLVFDAAGEGRPNIVRGDRPLQLNTWHTVRVSRINDKGRSSLSLNLKLDTLVFDAAGEGRPNIVRGDRPLRLNTWHTVRVSRINDKGMSSCLYNDGQAQGVLDYIGLRLVNGTPE